MAAVVNLWNYPACGKNDHQRGFKVIILDWGTKLFGWPCFGRIGPSSVGLPSFDSSKRFTVIEQAGDDEKSEEGSSGKTDLTFEAAIKAQTDSSRNPKGQTASVDFQLKVSSAYLRDLWKSYCCDKNFNSQVREA